MSQTHHYPKYASPRKCDCGADMIIGVSGWVCPSCPARIKPATGDERRTTPVRFRNCESSEHPCPECGGNGTVECEACVDGQAECPECSSLEYVECDECHGDGYLECDRCGGLGVLNQEEKQ